MQTQLPKIGPRVPLPSIAGKKRAPATTVIEHIPFAGLAIQSFDSKTFSLSSEQTVPSGVFFSAEGDRFYVCDQNSDIFEYDVSTDFDVSTASHSGVSLTQDTTTPRDIWFSPDGTQIYILYNTGAIIHQHTLAVAWDLSTVGGSIGTFGVGTEDATPIGLALSNDGKRMYLLGGATNKMYEYLLGRPFNVSTAVFNFGPYDYGTAFEGPIFAGPNGDALWYMDDVNDRIFRVSMDDGDLSTGANGSNSLDVTAQNSAAHGICFGDKGRILYVTGDVPVNISQFKL